MTDDGVQGRWLGLRRCLSEAADTQTFRKVFIEEFGRAFARLEFEFEGTPIGVRKMSVVRMRHVWCYHVWHGTEMTRCARPAGSHVRPNDGHWRRLRVVESVSDRRKRHLFTLNVVEKNRRSKIVGRREHDPQIPTTATRIVGRVATHN